MSMQSFLPSLWKQGQPAPTDMRSLQREIDRVFDGFTRGFGLPEAFRFSGTGAVSLAVDIKENDKELEITAELPGVKTEDIDVHMEGDVLVISGEKRTEKEQKDAGYHLVERSYGNFRRAIPLPFIVKEEKISADFSEGILKIRIAKPAEIAKARKKIEIRSK